MQRYREALEHLNAALDIMIDTGDTLMIAAVVHPIAMVERSILEQQAAVIRQRFPAAATSVPHRRA